METQKTQSVITYKIEKNQFGFYTTTLYVDGNVIGYVYTNTKTEARKTTSSQKKLKEHAQIFKTLSNQGE